MSWCPENFGSKCWQAAKTAILGVPYLLVRPAMVAFATALGAASLGGDASTQTAVGATAFTSVLYVELKSRLPATWNYFEPVDDADESAQQQGFLAILRKQHPAVILAVTSAGVVFVHNTFLGVHSILDWVNIDQNDALIGLGVWAAISHVIVFASFGGKKMAGASGMVMGLWSGNKALQNQFKWGEIPNRGAKTIALCMPATIAAFFFFYFATGQTMDLLPWSKAYSDTVRTTLSILGGTAMTSGIVLAKGLGAYLWFGKPGLELRWHQLGPRQRSALLLDVLMIGLMIPSYGFGYWAASEHTLKSWGVEKWLARGLSLPIALNGMGMEWPYAPRGVIEETVKPVQSAALKEASVQLVVVVADEQKNEPSSGREPSHQ